MLVFLGGNCPNLLLEATKSRRRLRSSVSLTSVASQGYEISVKHGLTQLCTQYPLLIVKGIEKWLITEKI